MKSLSLVEFGPTDAAVDRDFINKYVEENNFKILCDNHYSIITGEKGSGKTALIKGLTLKHSNEFTHIINIKFNDISFLPVVEHLDVISKTSNISSLALMANYWRYCLIVEAMKEIIGKKKLQATPLEIDIYHYLVENNHIEEDLFSRFLHLSLKAWKLIDTATHPQNIVKNNLTLLPTDLLIEINNFPLKSKKYPSLEKDFAEYLRKKQFKILITLDGLDILQINSKNSYNQITLVFEGLIATTYEISTSPSFSDNILIKSLIPYDIYLGLQLRDIDKYEGKYRKIRWDYKSLQEFLRKRIINSLDFNQTVTFEKAWAEIFPLKVKNSHIDIEEDSFEYFLRHTLYRPRHFQIHFEFLSENYGGRIMNSEMISEILEESNKSLVKYLINELKLIDPNFEETIKHFRKKSNIICYSDFRKFTKNILEKMSISIPVESEIDFLYQFGFIGLKRDINVNKLHSGVLFRYQPPVKQGAKPYICDFHHNSPNIHFTNGLQESDEIVIHPIFYEYCDINPNKELIIG